MTGQRGFGVLWAANTLSNLADGLAFVALPLLAASLTADPRLIAGLPLGYALVRLMFALPTGVWVDRLDRRRLLSAANMLRGLGFLALAMGFQFSSPGLVSLYLAMAVIALLEGAADTAAMAILPQIVPTRELDQANSKIAATQLVADEFVGPPLGGLIFAFAAAAPLYFMGGLWTVASLLALALSPALKPAQMPGKPRHIWSEAGDGIRWLVTHGVVGPLGSHRRVSEHRLHAAFFYSGAFLPGKIWGSAPPATACCSRFRPSAAWWAPLLPRSCAPGGDIEN